ncbi:GDP-L-fucose synthase [Flavobacteriaceae bacterium]|nr:GDP-L-fucose synthase [Flavobacteriaceae bacterium]
MTKLAKSSKIYIAGHSGMVGSACWKILQKSGYTNLIGQSSKDLDLRNQIAVKDFLLKERPKVIIDCAAKVGGILANDKYPFDFILDNLQIQNNLIKTSHDLNIKKFIFLGSSCIYPKFAKQPIKEEYLLTGSLEDTNQWYALAKISGIKLIEALRKQHSRDYIALMPTNLYGPNDNYNLETSHVLPALIRKFHEAKILNKGQVKLWGSGEPLREFLFVDDLAYIIKFFVENDTKESLINVGSSSEISIRELSSMIKTIVGFEGKVLWDLKLPNGTPRKLLDSSKIKSYGLIPKVSLLDGIKITYQDFLNNYENIKRI